MSGSPRWQSNWLLRGGVALGLAIAGVLLIFTAVGRPSVPPAPQPSSGPTSARSTPSLRPTPVAERSSTPAARHGIRDRITGPVLPESDPVFVAIPRIGVRSDLVRLGLDPQGALAVPRDPAQAGWFTGSAAPGALGPAVIAGHVTWNGVPAVFYRLGGLRPGDRVIVGRRDGRTAVFTINRVASFPKSRFPSHAVYGAIDHAGLRLITCGGTYDAARHRYLSNVVAFARLSAVHESRDR
jgi:hypothetical protein